MLARWPLLAAEGQTVEGEIDTVIILKCENHCASKDSINKVRRQATDWQKIVATGPGLELPQISRNDTDSTMETWPRDTKAIHRRGNAGDQRDDENVSAPLIRDTQIKNTNERHLAPSERHKFQSLTIASVSLAVERQKLAVG